MMVFGSDVKVFVNPLSRQVILDYQLVQDVMLKFRVFRSDTGEMVVDDQLISGNPGAKEGHNKWLWDGKDKTGARLATRDYEIDCLLGDTVISGPHVINFSFDLGPDESVIYQPMQRSVA